jgi:hypothetical protein
MTTCVRQAWLDLDGTGATTLPLENTAAGYWCSSLDLGFPAVREVVNNNPDRDGLNDRTAYMGGRAVSANIITVAGPAAHIDAVASSFAPYMAPAARPVLHYILDRPGLPERTLVLRGAGYSWPVADPAQRNIQLQWVAADPICYDPAVQTVTALWTGGTATIATNGDIAARPLIRVTGPLNAPNVQFIPDVGFIWWLAFLGSFTVAAGHHVDIDLAAHTVFYDSDPALPRLAQLDWTTTTWQDIPPAPHSTTIQVAGTSGTGATKVTATWQDGYLT